MHSKNKPPMTAAERLHVGRAQWFENRFHESATGVKVQCEVCARSMWLPKSKAGKYKTCGTNCAALRTELMRAARARSCVTCLELFVPRLTQIRAGTGLYCSQACNVKSHLAMNASEAQVKARANWRLTFQNAPFAKSGEANHRWNGGRTAARQRRLPQNAAYKRKNADKVRAWAATRRLKVGGSVPSNLVKQLILQQRGKCPVCRQKFGADYHLDHIQPVARGGGNQPWNLQILCRTCNLNKAAKDPIAFMQSRGFLL